MQKQKRKPQPKKPNAALTRAEARRIARPSLLMALVLTVGLAVFAALRPLVLYDRARSFAAAGDIDATEELLSGLGRDGYDPDALTNARVELLAALVGQSRWDEALDRAEGLTGDVADGLVLRARYGKACAQYDARVFEAAGQAFYQLGNYADSPERYLDCLTALAVETWLNGDEETARHQLLNIEDVDQRIVRVVEHAAGERAAELLALDTFSPEWLSHQQASIRALDEVRSAGVSRRVAAGYRHTVGVTGAGAVLAAGDDSFGQCDVSDWSDVISVAAGAYHTVGLRSDGTVLAAGDNSRGQLDVSEWRGITQIAATAYGTLGLQADGTVIMCGEGSAAVSGWHGVTAVAGGSYAAACLYGPGSMLCTHPTAQLSMNAALTRLSVCGPVSAGIDGEGRLVCSFEGAPEWNGLTDVWVSENAVLGVTVDGRAAMYVFRTGQVTYFPQDGAAEQICAGGTHQVIMTADGRVYAFGDDTYGQCGTDDWWLK